LNGKNQQGDKKMTYYIAPYAPRVVRRMAARNAESARSLALDIRDEGEAYLLRALVPGLKAEDLNIQVLDDTVSIEGEFRREDGEFLMSELPTGPFHRALRLPVALDAEKAEAKIDDGVLSLHLPKSESVRPKTIKVSYN
jgi:HSP20 family protein